MKHRACAVLAVLLLVSMLTGCMAPAAPVAAPQPVEVTRVVEKEVPVEVTRVVEKVVEKEVPAAEGAAAAAPEGVTLEVLSPAGQASVSVIPFAPRVDTLEGKTVALHWNGKPGGEFLLHEVQDRLAAQYKDIKFVQWPDGTAWAADVAKFMKETPADVAILSVGD